jgi:hypothetical protein
MKKYNKSEIMKNAWSLKRTSSNSFAECLKRAWELAKSAVSEFRFTKIAPWFLKKMDSVSYMALESGIAIDDIKLERETEKAIQISTEWNGFRKMMWFPKSVCEYTLA